MAKKDNYNKDYYFDNNDYEGNNDFEDSSEEKYDDEKSSKLKTSFLSNKKISSIFAIILLITILLVLAIFILPLLRPDLVQKPKISVNGEDGEGVLGRVIKLDSDGNFVDAFLLDGKKIVENVNPNETKQITLKTNGVNTGKVKSATIVLGSDTRITLSPDNVTIFSDGTITALINPQDDLLLDDEFFSLLETNPELAVVDYILELVIENTNENNETEDIILEVPMQFIFSEFLGTGCLELNRNTVFESTHNGLLEIDAKLKVSCETNDALFAMTKWYTKRMGNIEVLLNEYSSGSIISPFPVELKKNIPVGTYNLKIIYSPLKEFAGEKASFDLIFGSGNSESKIIFDVVGENLEQCIKVTALDSIIEDESDTALIEINASRCASKRIDIYVCDGMPSCTTASEAGVEVSSSYFSLTGSKTKTITIQRDTIPGVYGVRIHAKIPGLEKSFIDEKEILVKPTNELLIPDRFNISLMGKETRDVIRVKNTSLAEEIEIDASVCNVYKSSLGIEGSTTATGSSVSPISAVGFEKGWIRKLSSDQKLYSGIGKHQSALYGYLPQIDNIRATTQSISKAKNYEIKKAYLEIMGLSDDITKSVEKMDTVYAAIQELDKKADEYNKFKDVDEASFYLSLLTSATTLINTQAHYCTDETLAAAKAVGSVSTESSCALAATQLGIVAVAACGSGYLNAENLVETIKKMIDPEKKPKMDTDKALEEGENNLDTVEALDEQKLALEDYADLLLSSASIKSTTSIQKDYLETKKYLEFAKKEMSTQLENLKKTREATVKLDDALTELQEPLMSTEDEIKAWAGLILEATDLIVTILHQLGVDTTMNGLAEKNCKSAIDSITAANTANKGILFEATWMKVTLQALSLTNSTYQLWRQYTLNFKTQLEDSKAANQEALDQVDIAILGAEKALVSIDAAILAADYLARESAKISDAASYNIDLTYDSEIYDKERLTGLVATAMAVGFINGAYEGGVYTTRDTDPFSTNVSPLTNNSAQTLGEKENNKKIFFATNSTMVEDCDNRIKLKLMDYKINLLYDTKEVVVSDDSVLAFWSFYDPKVYGFYEQQETSLVFTNAGLKKNTYGVVELRVDKHSHDQITKPTNEFGPFNIQDSSKEEITYKYHFKFNAAPRKTSSTISNPVCENGLLLGGTGSEALPKILLDWEWKNITSEDTKDKFLDSTQLAILVSKRLAAFDEFLNRAGTNCPQNPTEKIIQTIKPTDAEFISAGTCHIPLTTREYEGKPALYYHLSLVTSLASEDYDEFFDGPLATNAEEGLALLDFNVLLMRDGLGLDFQSDFVYDYTQSILKSSSIFNNLDNGIAKYFRLDDRFHFTSEAFEYKPKTEFILPDAGLYRIQILIDFDDPSNARLFNGGSIDARIKVIPTLIQPVNQEYSPLYYTPFDGSVGLNASNNRRGYGSALSVGDSFSISKQAGSYLQKEQKNSLIKTKSVMVEDFFTLNSLPSRRGRILEYSYNYNFPPNYTADTNSLFIFTPTIATPLIITLQGKEEEIPVFSYIPKTGSMDLKPKTNNLFLFSGIKGCSDFYGTNIMETLNKTPDFMFGETYGLAFMPVTNPGKVSAKTIAYSPTKDSYELIYQNTGTLEVTNQTQIEEKAPLEGIQGMHYNDLLNNSKINSLQDLFNAVENRSVCVSNLSGKEIYWWPEDYLYEKETPQGNSILKRELEEKVSCIK